MQSRALAGLLLLLLIVQPAAGQHYFGDTLGTNDFALVAQLHCSRLIDAGAAIRSEKCPHALSDAYNRTEMQRMEAECAHIRAGSMRVHLARDPRRRHPPRLLYVYANKHTRLINYAVAELALAESTQWEVPRELKRTTHDKGARLEMNEQIASTVFDSESNLLYIMTQYAGSMQHFRRVHIVQVSKIFEGTPAFVDLARTINVHSSNSDRYGWTEEPYERMVYYMRTNATHSAVQRLPLNELLPSFIEGREGETVAEIPERSRAFVWAHGGALITHATGESTRGPTDLYYVRQSAADGTTRGSTCSVLEQSPAAAGDKKPRGLIALLGWDYCILRHGGDGTRGADGQPCPLYYAEMAAADSSFNSYGMAPVNTQGFWAGNAPYASTNSNGGGGGAGGNGGPPVKRIYEEAPNGQFGQYIEKMKSGLSFIKDKDSAFWDKLIQPSPDYILRAELEAARLELRLLKEGQLPMSTTIEWRMSAAEMKERIKIAEGMVKVKEEVEKRKAAV